MSDHDVVRVFTGPEGSGGSPLGIVLNGSAMSGQVDRQQRAAELGFSETVFVDDAERGVVDIYTPSTRMLFAGYPLVGTAWLLRRHGYPADVLRTPAGDVPCRQEGGVTWISARADWVTGKRTEQFATAADVDALPVPPPGEGWLYAWAFEDEAATGRIRARGFPRRGDAIAEDEATGAAAIILTAELGRSLTIRQGAGSWIFTELRSDGTVELGGRVTGTAADSGYAAC